MYPRALRRFVVTCRSLLILSLLVQPLTPLTAPTKAIASGSHTRPTNQQDINTPKSASVADFGGENVTEEEPLFAVPEEGLWPALPVQELPPAQSEPEVPYQETAPAPVLPIADSDDPFTPPTLPVEIPDTIWGEEPPPASDTDPALLGTIELPATPVYLSVELDRYVLFPGEQAKLSVAVRQDGAALTSHVAVTLTLPPQLQIIGDPAVSKVWSYDASALASGIHQTFSLGIRDTFALKSAAVAEIRLEAAAPGYQTWGKRWLVGIAGPASFAEEEAGVTRTSQSATGNVLHTPGLTILVPANAAPVGAEIEYTPLYTATVSKSEQTSPIDIAAVPQPISQQGSQLYLPALRQEPSVTSTQAGAPVSEPVSKTKTVTSFLTLEDNGLSIYRLWHLEAAGLVNTASTSEATPNEEQESVQPHFSESLLMVVDVADLVAQGVDMSMLALWTRPDAGHDWRPLPFARYDEKRQSWIAWLTHFSDFSLSIDPAANGEYLPSLKGHVVDHQTGSANFSYPIDAPSGVGGLNPNLSLNYSSQHANDLLLTLGNDNSKDVQASVIGYGWTLRGMNFITKFRDRSQNVYYSLALNGQTYDIREIPGQSDTYDTDPISFAAIKLLETSTTSEWHIKTPDGTLYVFGGPKPYASSNYEWPVTTAEINSHIEMHFYVFDSQREREVSAWHLRRVEDTTGNILEYTVTTQRGEVSNSACHPGGLSDNFTWYTKSARLSQVAYNGNTGKYNNGTATPASLRVSFEYAPRQDISFSNGCQRRHTDLRLSKIKVEALQVNSSSVWHILRRYELDDHYLTGSASGYLRHLQLEKIDRYGKDASATKLNTYSFSYESVNGNSGDTEYNIRLKSINNGLGGKITYTYSKVAADCPEPDDPCDENELRLVSRMQLEDGQGNYYITDFYLNRPHVRIESNRLIYMGTEYANSHVYQPTTNPTGPLVVARFEEYTFLRGVFNNPDAREGKLHKMVIRNHSGSGNIRYYEALYTWQSFRRNSSNNGWESITFRFPGPIWTRLDAKEEWTANAGKKETYFYDNSNYATTFGNLVKVEEYSHAEDFINYTGWTTKLVTLQRRTLTEYFPNTGWLTNATAPYIVDRPARVLVQDGSGACASESRTIYTNFGAGDQNRNGEYDAAPLSAFVAKSAHVLSNCPLSNDATDWEDSRFLVTTYIRDSYGNETTRTSHNGGGSQNIAGVTAYDPFYHLFPVERWNAANNSVKAKANYYGVGAIAVDGGRGFWGAMSESCAINNVCTRYSYDQFGRKIHQWERQVGSSGWPTYTANTDDKATTRWAYRKPGELSAAQTTYIVTEWHAPRCQGNFVRRHYDGLGQLIIEQKSYQDYDFDVNENCGGTPTATGHDIVTRFKYDAFGNQVEATIPRLYNYAAGYLYYAPPNDWSVKSQTLYDPLLRVTQTAAPNGEVTVTSYTGRRTDVIAIGRNGHPNQMLRSTTVNALGYLSLVRASHWKTTNNEWQDDGHVAITTGVLGNVIKTEQIGIEDDDDGDIGYPVVTSTYGYDQAGRLTHSNINNRASGVWEYRYDRHSQLIWQKDSGTSRTLTCLYYDEYGRLRGKHFKGDNVTCDPLAANDHENYLYGTTGSAQGQLTQVTLRDSVNGAVAYQKNYAYNAAGQLETETVAYPLLGQQYATSYGYENLSGRLQTIYYPANFTPNNERVVYKYNGMGLVESVESNVQGWIVEAVGYDVLGRTTSLRYSGTLNTQYLYYPWTSANGDSNARLRDLRVGGSLGGNGKLSLSYNYDSFGNITSLGEMYRNANYAVHSFVYDDLSRLQTSTYSGLPALHYQTEYDGRPLLYEGKTNHYDPLQPQAVDYYTIGGNTLAYTRDGNGNAALREVMNGGSKVTQTLEWNRSNQLQQVKVGTQVLETYRYDAQGQRTYKANASGTTVYPFPFFEVEGATATRYYLLNGQPIALRTGTDAVTVLHRDQVGSVVMTTLLNGAVLQDRRYLAYGNKRAGSDFSFEQDYTGQRRDATGLLYYNARYYDPQLGQFISPDSIIPDPTDYFSYNRYLYARANPLKYNDPTGHAPNPVIPPSQGFDISSLPNWMQLAICMFATCMEQGAKVVASNNMAYLPDPSGMSVTPMALASEADDLVSGILRGVFRQSDEFAHTTNNAAQWGYRATLREAADPDSWGNSTKLYRAVTEAEFAQIAVTGALEASSSSAGGKYFAENLGDAITWGNKLEQGGAFRIIEVELPTDVADSFFRWDRLDQIGPARYAEIEQLQNLDYVIRELAP